jgi:hypothetical protein
MKYGVLIFSYNNVISFKDAIEARGYYSINLGDYMQTLAARNLYRAIGIGEDDIIDIDRDSLSSYRGEKVVLLMNGAFFRWSFPIPQDIVPVFIGFRADRPVLSEHQDFFRRHQPIGCRDVETTELFRAHNVEAFTSGCLTMTFQDRARQPAESKVFAIFGSGAGAFPADALTYMPEELARDVEFILQRKVVHNHPLTAMDMKEAENHAKGLLQDYRTRASLVVTPLHHAATPCLASGIPVVLCRKRDHGRFSYLRELMPVYTSAFFSQVDWAPGRVPIDRIRTELVRRTRLAIEAAARQSL